ncbi:MAG: glycosyltransferase family 1 protein [Anaerolineae bacterium]|nr:glycosyltransferase family 1 protein [Anaerolineae bacterium]
MRITILTYGTRGDVQPYVALGIGLQRAGFTVRLAAPEPFADVATGYGLDFAPLPGDPAALSRALVDEAGWNLLRTISAMFRFGLPLAKTLILGVFAACDDADAIIHSFLVTPLGHLIAQERGLPEFGAYPLPIFIQTTAFQNPSFPASPFPVGPLRRAYHRLTHALFTQIMWQLNRLSYAGLRAFRSTWPPFPDFPFGDTSIPILFGFSPQVVPRAPEWPTTIHPTGYWTLPAPDDWQPPADLVDFLAAGPPPVYIGFGSMTSRSMDQVTAAVRDALGLTGQRAIIGRGWSNWEQAAQADNLLVIDSVPHDWLFPQMAAVVHHGGAGTTAAGLRAGVPSIIVPFTSDQPFWGWRVKSIGVGPEPIPRRRLTGERLAYALRVAATHQPMRERAAALGETLRAEDGVGQAVAVINGYLNAT